MAVPHISLRTPRPDEAGDLAELMARTFRDTYADQNLPADLARHLRESYGAPLQAAELADPAIVTRYVEVDGSIAGFGQLRLAGPRPACVTDPAAIELWRFYLDRPWQGRGLAHPFIEGLKQLARERDGALLWLGVWERNPRAIAFYQRAGFTPVGRQIYRVGADDQHDHVMACPLAAGAAARSA